MLRVGVLALDLARRQARMGETVADLADREFRLLHFLMLHPGEVISRQRLLSEVWGFDFDPRSNVVDVCVRGCDASSVPTRRSRPCATRATAPRHDAVGSGGCGDRVRRLQVEMAWAAFAGVNYAAMIAWPSWETIPFHFVWISLTLLYGFRVWDMRPDADRAGAA